MTPFHQPVHSQLSHSPAFCRIPIKFIVLAMQAAALILQIFIIFSVSEVQLLIHVLLIVYTAFTFASFFYEHKGLMTLHCALFIVVLSVLIIVDICFYFISYPDIEIENIFGEGKLAKTFICIFVAAVYIAMCWALVKALKKNETLPNGDAFYAVCCEITCT